MSMQHGHDMHLNRISNYAQVSQLSMKYEQERMNLFYIYVKATLSIPPLGTAVKGKLINQKVTSNFRGFSKNIFAIVFELG